MLINDQRKKFEAWVVVERTNVKKYIAEQLGVDYDVVDEVWHE